MVSQVSVVCLAEQVGYDKRSAGVPLHDDNALACRRCACRCPTDSRFRLTKSGKRILKAVVLTFDRMPAHLLGCYGNEWTETPGFDRLAARASVFDQHFAELPGPVGPDHSWWTGQFEFFAESGAEKLNDGEESPNWIRSLAAQGVRCRLVAEDSEGLPTELFNSSETVSGADGLNAEHDNVPIARLVQRGIELLGGDDAADASAATNESSPELLWLHSRGVPSPWLPPRLFAELYLDELEELLDGESGSEIARNLVNQFETEPDLIRLLLSDWQRDVEDDSTEAKAEPRAGADPGDVETRELEQQISRLVFAGYVSMIDRWLLKLLSAIESCDDRVLLIVSANQGRSFGEGTDLMVDPVRQPVGDSDGSSGHAAGKSGNGRAGSLYDSELRTPLMIAEYRADSGDQSFGSRHWALVQPIDVAATVHEWFCRAADESAAETSGTKPDLDGCSLLEAISGGTPNGHERTFHLGPDGQVGVRNRHWALLASDVNVLDDSAVRLFAKPDDQWDVNDVSSQYPEEVDDMLEALRNRKASR